MKAAMVFAPQVDATTGVGCPYMSTSPLMSEPLRRPPPSRIGLQRFMTELWSQSPTATLPLLPASQCPPTQVSPDAQFAVVVQGRQLLRVSSRFCSSANP